MSEISTSGIPFLGSGLGYRRELKKEILASRGAIDFLEVIADEFIEDRDAEEELEELCASFPIIPHGVGLSIGSVAPLDDAYLRAIRRVSDITNSAYYSEHVSMSRAPGIDIGHLSPLFFSDEVLEHTIGNVRRVQEFLSKPLVLENVAYLFEIPGGSMKQSEFITRLVKATNCGILLDVTNAYINSTNHHFDALSFIREIPVEYIVQVHLAGGDWSGELLLDTHSGPIQDESWQLLEALAKIARIRGSIIEHDTNFPEDMSILLQQVDKARRAITASNTMAAGSDSV